MPSPTWVETAANAAMISRAELFEWLGVRTAPDLRALIDVQGFPPPRMYGPSCKRGSSYITHACRWRVGDVRAWLSGRPDAYARELAVPLVNKPNAMKKRNPWDTPKSNGATPATTPEATGTQRKATI